MYLCYANSAFSVVNTVSWLQIVGTTKIYVVNLVTRIINPVDEWNGADKVFPVRHILCAHGSKLATGVIAVAVEEPW